MKDTSQLAVGVPVVWKKYDRRKGKLVPGFIKGTVVRWTDQFVDFTNGIGTMSAPLNQVQLQEEK